MNENQSHSILNRLAAISFLAIFLPVEARVIRTFPEAVQLLYPTGDNMKRQSVYLSAEQMKRASDLAQEKIDTAFFAVYRVTQAKKFLAWVYLDTHRVRTLNETILVSVGADSRIQHIEVLSFNEPPEYVAGDRFLELFRARRLDAELSLKGNIPTITGATLTCSAITSAARRVLALHQVASAGYAP